MEEKHRYRTSHSESQLISRWPRKMTVRHMRILQTRSTRRMRKLAYKADQALRRIKKLLARQLARRENFLTRQQVKTLKAAKRTPHKRVRSADELRAEFCPDPRTYYRNAAGVITAIGRWPLSLNCYWGFRKMIVDFTPILLTNPPHNETSIGSFRVNALKASVDLVPVIKSRPIQRMALGKWAYKGLVNHGILSSTPQPINFDMALANKALQKAIARVYEADIQTNEYIVEWKQVVKLLKDPFRTVLQFHRVLKRWTRKDAWMWIPERRYRKFGAGVLVSKVPSGGVLMSMRTRREISTVGVSKEVLNAACNRWLQYRYGIAPVMADLTTVMDLWLNPVQPPHLKSVSARYWVQRPKKVHSTQPLSHGPFGLTFKRVKTTGEFYSAKVWFDRAEDSVPLAYKLGMHPSQWLNVIWNGIPYSFVADWVINLDEWMTSQRDVPWIKLRGNVVTHKTFENFRALCVSAVDGTYFEKAVITGLPVATIHRESINRKVDLPRTMEPFLSSAWSSVKNAMTAAALVLSPVLTESLSKQTRKR